ncbi:MAG TPA: alkaline phosphatase family protein [Actinomycetota bacterium]|nr:alkaline phosphatase family protein [Actinomycetota bacterium]
MTPRLVVLGWDSATFDVIDPLVAQGRLPALASLIERGNRATLMSTWPPMTDCAWTSAFTGRNPGAHGIFGSWYRAPGAYECRYFSSRDRRAPAMWELTDDVRWLVWNVPMTYPPNAIEGAMVAGYGAPPGSRFCAPASFQDDLAQRWPLEDLLDRAPHSTLQAFRSDLLRGLETQAEALPWAARTTGADCVVAVWPQVDRAQHFFWRFRGTDHPLADVVDEVYEAMDRATAAIVDAFPDADVMVVSDHGAGDLKGDVNVGAWLAAHGHAAYASPKRSIATELAWALPPRVRTLGRRLAPGLARKAMGAFLVKQLGPFDWSSTDAFVGVHNDLWLNLEGREESGTVPESRADEVLDEMLGGLLAVTDPATGEHVFAGAYRRSEIYTGLALDLAPDVMLDPWSQGYRVAVKREPSDQVVIPPAPLAGVGEAWSSDHRPEGIFVAAGPRIEAGRSESWSLCNIAPLSLALLGEPVVDGLEGSVPRSVVSPSFLEGNPVRARASTGERAAGGGFSTEEAEAVAEHLRHLGYID